MTDPISVEESPLPGPPPTSMSYSLTAIRDADAAKKAEAAKKQWGVRKPSSARYVYPKVSYEEDTISTDMDGKVKIALHVMAITALVVGCTSICSVFYIKEHGTMRTVLVFFGGFCIVGFSVLVAILVAQ